MKHWQIPCSWEMYGTMDIEAETLEQALQIAEDEYLPYAEYVEGSFVVDEQIIEELYPEEFVSIYNKKEEEETKEEKEEENFEYSIPPRWPNPRDFFSVKNKEEEDNA